MSDDYDSETEAQQELDLSNSDVVTKYKKAAEIVNSEPPPTARTALPWELTRAERPLNAAALVSPQRPSPR